MILKSKIGSSWGAGLASLFFPQKCPFCRLLLAAEAEDLPGLCPDCAKNVRWIEEPQCPRCGWPFNKGTDSHLCPDCLRGKHHFDRARAMLEYQGPVAEAIHRFKYRGEIQLADVLGRFWKQDMLKEVRGETIIPVPLHPSRLRERGFNQALILGRILGRMTDTPLLIKGLRRIRNTLPQIQLDHAQREKNVRGAFLVKDPQAVRGKNILVVDDVFTTGATVNECTKVLKKAGAGRIFVLTLARVGLE